MPKGLIERMLRTLVVERLLKTTTIMQARHAAKLGLQEIIRLGGILGFLFGLDESNILSSWSRILYLTTH